MIDCRVHSVLVPKYSMQCNVPSDPDRFKTTSETSSWLAYHQFGTLQVLNDFVAVGYAIPTLAESDLVTINPGERVQGGPVAVIGPGTGLGECQLMWDSGVSFPLSDKDPFLHHCDAPRRTRDNSVHRTTFVSEQAPLSSLHSEPDDMQGWRTTLRGLRREPMLGSRLGADCNGNC